MEQSKVLAVVSQGIGERQLMLKNPDVINALTPSERAVFGASASRPIVDYEASELTTEILTALAWIFKDVGYRCSEEGEKQYLVIRVSEILKRYYSHFSVKDFRMAFEMSITGELDAFLPRNRDGQPDRGHYQQFSAEYVCKILGAYKARRAQIIQKAYAALPTQAEEPDPEIVAKYEGIAKGWLIDAFAEYTKTGQMPRISVVRELVIYGILSNAGLAPEIEVTADEQRQVWQSTLNEYARAGMVGDLHRLKDEGPTATELQARAQVLRRHKALEDAFAKMRADGVVLVNELIK